MALLSRSRVYLLSPYILLGVALWAFVYAGGLHATLAGVVLALFIPTRPPADLAEVMLFLTSEKARAVTGALIAVRGRV